jgi:beta-lactamase regulating signal transducer with metallopeptidase domain
MEPPASEPALPKRQATAAVGRSAATSLALAGEAALWTWCIASAVFTVWQIKRILRFRRGLRLAVPAPQWILDEADCVARRVGVRAPEILVVPEPATPMLWFLGRPKLLLPGRLLNSLGPLAWRGVMAHEFAHLARRDHWVRRLTLAAGLLWWWNPLYWLTRRRLDAESELACDEWAVRAFPEGRFAFAEALLEVSRSCSYAASPAPALGVAGAGRFLERRVTMILREQTPSRGAAAAFLGAALLTLLAIPGWSASADPPRKKEKTSVIRRDEAGEVAELAEKIAKIEAEKRAVLAEFARKSQAQKGKIVADDEVDALNEEIGKLKKSTADALKRAAHADSGDDRDDELAAAESDVAEIMKLDADLQELRLDIAAEIRDDEVNDELGPEPTPDAPRRPKPRAKVDVKPDPRPNPHVKVDAKVEANPKPHKQVKHKQKVKSVDETTEEKMDAEQGEKENDLFETKPDAKPRSEAEQHKRLVVHQIRELHGVIKGLNEQRLEVSRQMERLESQIEKLEEKLHSLEEESGDDPGQ